MDTGAREDRIAVMKRAIFVKIITLPEKCRVKYHGHLY